MWTGSTVDAMSDAIEGADVMLYGVSLRYKESANVRCSSALRWPTLLTVSRLAPSLLRARVCVLWAQCRMGELDSWAARPMRCVDMAWLLVVRLCESVGVASEWLTPLHLYCAAVLQRPTMPINRSST